MGVADVRALQLAVQRLAEPLPDPGPAVPGASQRRVADLLSVAYRLVFATAARARGATVTLEEACRGLDLATVPGGLLDPPLLEHAAAALAIPDPGLPAVVALGAMHEGFLSADPGWHDGRLRFAGTSTARKVAGTWFTPVRLVEKLLDDALDPFLEESDDPGALTVCDPSCGAGLFLVAVAHRIARHLAGVPASAPGTAVEPELLARAVTRCVHGVDVDPSAVELTRVALWLELVQPGRPAAMPALRLHAGEALLGVDWAAAFPEAHEAGGFDVVVGNPPFLNRLETRTAPSPEVAARLDAASGGALRPYTDVSAVFLQRAVSWIRPGGRVALVQPQSLLAARDAAGVREHLAVRCSLEALWASDEPVFDASVLTCAPVLRRGATQGAVRRTHGPAFEPVPPRHVTTEDLRGEWSFLVAAGLGTPELVLDPSAGTLGDLATCTADFRDQYYGLRPYLREAAECEGCRCVPLVTTGLIDPAELLWGQRATRVLKQRWMAPTVDLDALEADPALARWARARLVPKVLVGTQGRVVEAVVDATGELLPSVPTVTVTAPPERLWHVLAVLLAPPVVAHAATRYAGTGLTMRSVKLSAKQVAALPLPPDPDGWDRAAGLLPTAQRDDERRPELLAEVAGLMCRAYGVDDPGVLRWWLERAGLRST
ncbi:MAG TPA: N-6 DNA methylase [Marmoricola sp.]|nr:N-6 DNA methylase [Marmoricola sp.]